MVNSLFCVDHMAWDMDTVKDLFIERYVNMIQSIPLSFRHSKDVFSWRWDPKGIYTIKSAYCFLITQNSDVPSFPLF